jgi:cyclin A
MRAILVDWLVEVAEEYRLCADTLYLTVNYIDRFLSVYPVQRSQLQLVGVACMWVAAKYEEIYPPNVSDFCFITDNTYTKEQMVAMEELILKRLAYELTVPTAKTFLRRMLQVGTRGSQGCCLYSRAHRRWGCSGIYQNCQGLCTLRGERICLEQTFC